MSCTFTKYYKDKAIFVKWICAQMSIDYIILYVVLHSRKMTFQLKSFNCK